MRLICPSCGAIASAETWQNEMTVRQFLGVLDRLPGRVRDLALPYLGLFRRSPASGSSSATKGLAWPRALRLLQELAALVEPGTVHWEGGEERPATPLLWAEALDAVLARRPKDLENHNYLRKVAWERSQGLASHAERDRESQRRQSDRPRDAPPEESRPDPRDDAPHPGEDRMSREQWADLKHALGKIGQ